jgi:hypothetical protein
MSPLGRIEAEPIEIPRRGKESLKVFGLHKPFAPLWPVDHRSSFSVVFEMKNANSSGNKYLEILYRAAYRDITLLVYNYFQAFLTRVFYKSCIFI